MIAVRAARLAFAAFDIAAVVQALGDTAGSLVNFFSFFTIESNLLAIAVLLVGGAADPRSRAWAWIRGAVTFFTVVTGIVYAALLANEEVGLTAAWVDAVMHQVIPAAVLADWLCFPPWFSRAKVRGAWPALAWLGFPLAYLVYSLSRGPAAGWYPYPFLDPRHPGGYGRVAAFCVVLAAVLALLALGIAAAGRWRASR
jgi:hypothetical protein